MVSSLFNLKFKNPVVGFGNATDETLSKTTVIPTGLQTIALSAKEILITGDSYVKLSDFTTGIGVGAGSTLGSTGNWVRLPNGMLLQWGTMPSRQDSYGTVYFPQAFSTTNVAVTVSGGVTVGDIDDRENPTTVIAVGSTFFQTWTTENVNTIAWWIAMGF